MSLKVLSRAPAPPPAAPSPTVADGQYVFSKDLVTLFEGRPRDAEAVRTMRTHVLARHLEDGRRGLSFCAPNVGAGCTYSAVNLAVSLAQVGVNTLLIDGDLRTCGADQFIRPAQAAPGLRDLLAGAEDRVHETIHEEVLPNLSVLFAGGVAENPQELLGGEGFKSLIDRCLRDYEFTIVDTPAANLCADGRRISSAIGYSVIVARRDVSFIEEISALTRQLEEDGARVIGAVLNET